MSYLTVIRSHDRKVAINYYYYYYYYYYVFKLIRYAVCILSVMALRQVP